jgi:hypothetical protein
MDGAEKGAIRCFYVIKVSTNVQTNSDVPLFPSFPFSVPLPNHCMVPGEGVFCEELFEAGCELYFHRAWAPGFLMVFFSAEKGRQ